MWKFNGNIITEVHLSPLTPCQKKKSEIFYPPSPFVRKDIIHTGFDRTAKICQTPSPLVRKCQLFTNLLSPRVRKNMNLANPPSPFSAVADIIYMQTAEI